MTIKKGNSSWKPAAVTEVTNKEDGFRYRWANKEPDNLAKKKAEGWEFVGSTDQAKPEVSNRLDNGASLTSVHEKRDVVLMKIPEELAQERDAYFSAETERRQSGLTAHLEKELSKDGAPAHGEITISSMKG